MTPVVDAAMLYDAALEGDAPLLARAADGTVSPLPLERWLGAAVGADERVLARARGPVLDVGCGPGRHVDALARRGVLAVGVDVSPVAAAIARRRGAVVLETSIFDRIPRAGHWRSALLLDGNIGIGGRPSALLRRVAALLTPDGAVLVECDAPGSGIAPGRVRLEHGALASGWFAWARVAVDEVEQPARAAGLRVAECWTDGGRWFAELEPA